MIAVRINSLGVGDKFKITNNTEYVHEVKQVLTDQTDCDKQYLCLTDDGNYTYYTIHYSGDYQVYLVNDNKRLRNLNVGDKFRWGVLDDTIKTVTDVAADHAVYKYEYLNRVWFVTYSEADSEWNRDVLLEGEVLVNED